MKKVLKKLGKAMLILILILQADLALVLNSVQAVSPSSQQVYQIDYCDKVLKYQGIPRGAAYVVYEENGEQNPAYCINPERIGVGETDAYNVNVNNYITDVMLWRIITNGYPYKSKEELGVANEKEAYLATKQAVYCYLDNRNVEEYSGIGEAGARTLKALKKIWYNAQSSTETKISNVVDIIPSVSGWSQDKLNPKCISKTYRIEAPAPIVDYEVEIKGEKLPNGLIVTNTKNIKNRVFSPFEEFKVLIPIDSLKNNGNFSINVQTKMDTKPVLYGVAQDSNLQNYALTTFRYEDAKGIYSEQYPKNEAQIKILKQEKETKAPLKGVEFQLLNLNKKVIYQNLLTDEKGQIILKNIAPGTYYLKEVRTLPGYVLYDEYIKIDINLNEQVNVIVNNTKEKNIEVSKEVTNIEVGKTQESIQDKTSETNIKNEINENNINKQANETNIKQEKNITNITEIMNQKNVQKLPKTGM